MDANKIDPSTLEMASRNSKRYLEQIGKKYAIDFNSIAGFEEEKRSVQKSLDLFVSGYLAFKETWDKDSELSSMSSSNVALKNTFTTILSMYGGAVEAIAELKSYKSNGKNQFSENINFEEENHSLDFAVCKYYSELKNVSDTAALIGTTKHFLDWIQNNIKEKQKDKKFSGMRNYVGSKPVKLINKVITGFSFNYNAAIPISPEMTYDTIIGNEEAILEIKNASRLLYRYNFDKMENPHKHRLKDTLLLIGEPGGGKSSLTAAMIADMFTASKKTNKEFKYVIIGNDVKNMYFGESVRILKERIDEVIDPSVIGIVIIDDADMVIQSRKSNNPHQSELELTKELMDYISGINTNLRSYGNHMFVLISNNYDGLDGALQDRTVERLIINGPKKFNERDSLNQIKLKKDISQGLISLDTSSREYKEAIELCIKYDLSGREMTNICKIISNSVIGKEITIDDLLISEEEFQKRVFAKKTEKDYLKIVKKFCQTKEELEKNGNYLSR
jgi:SpoVK/Ycf46/Vps4 family AAA+-type ATPase